MALVESVRTALGALELRPEDRAAAELALTYARAVDAGDELARIGPLLHATLNSLLMTPQARANALKGTAQREQRITSPLDELRRRRAARLNSAPPLDSAAT